MMVVVRNRSCTIYDNNRILKDLLVAEDPDSDDQVKPWAQAHHPNRQQVQFIAEHRRPAVRVRHLQSVERVLEEKVEQGEPEQDWLACAKEERTQEHDNRVGESLHDGEFGSAIDLIEIHHCLSVRVPHILGTASPLIEAARE